MDARLIFVKASGQRKDFPLTSPVTVIGRGEDCHLRVPLADVSRKHCEIRVGLQELEVKDLDSANGTFVNDSRVKTGPLKAGDKLALGKVVFTVQIDGQPAEIEPAQPAEQPAAAGEQDVEAAIKLEADIGGPEDFLIEQDEADVLAASAAAAQEQVDPIEALEALAAENEGEEEEKKE